jgi:putative oxidoreductase
MIDASTAPYAAVVLRLALGILFLAHGLLKLLVFKPAGAYAYLSEDTGLRLLSPQLRPLRTE